MARLARAQALRVQTVDFLMRMWRLKRGEQKRFLRDAISGFVPNSHRPRKKGIDLEIDASFRTFSRKIQNGRNPKNRQTGRKVKSPAPVSRAFHITPRRTTSPSPTTGVRCRLSTVSAFPPAILNGGAKKYCGGRSRGASISQHRSAFAVLSSWLPSERGRWCGGRFRRID